MISRRRVIAVDLDGVVYDFVGRLLDHLRYNHNIILRREDIRSFNVASLTGIQKVDLDLVAQIKNPEFYLKLQPLPRAYEMLLQLQQYGDLVAISNRPNVVLQATYLTCVRDFEWDASSTGSVFRYIHVGSRTPKHKNARACGAAWAIDDNPEIAMDYAKHRVCCFLVGQRQLQQPSRYIKRVGDLSDVVTFFERFCKGKVV